MSIDNLAINTLRFLSAEAIQKAKSGHPGLPLGAAPAAYVIRAVYPVLLPALIVTSPFLFCVVIVGVSEVLYSPNLYCKPILSDTGFTRALSADASNRTVKFL